jgi:hypothetical protein
MAQKPKINFANLTAKYRKLADSINRDADKMILGGMSQCGQELRTMAVKANELAGIFEPPKPTS